MLKCLLTAVLLSFACLPLAAQQQQTGELRVSVRDPSGTSIQGVVRLSAESTQRTEEHRTDEQGHLALKHLSFGAYNISVLHPGFAPTSQMVQVQSEVPQDIAIMLSIAPAHTTIEVAGNSPALQSNELSNAFPIGKNTLSKQPITSPGRGLIELVNMQPGWLLEANGVLHPRGAEYGTQYIIDGFPVTDNRSPAFAPAEGIDHVEFVRVLTSSYAAEFGRKLSGVIEVNTQRSTNPGFHGTLAGEAGSFATADTSFTGHYVAGKSALGLDLSGFRTDRFLDPPVLQNFNNTGSGGSFRARFDSDLNQTNSLRISVWHGRTGFMVPNEQAQQIAGQYQTRSNEETGAHVAYRHIFTQNLFASVRASVRDIAADLASNQQSVPIIASQERGLREYYTAASLNGEWKHHEWKLGADTVVTPVHEHFAYQITDSDFFDPALPPNFRFDGANTAREHSAFVQDVKSWRSFSVSAGLRFDTYRFLFSDHALSPRIGLGWRLPKTDAFIYSSYDRVYTTPAFENLLLSSSRAAQQLTQASTGLLIPASRGDFYQVGIWKIWFSRVRVDTNYFVRKIRNFADDDVLLNTGVSVPISFASADIRGLEAKVDVPKWGPVSGSLSYSNQVGTGFLPITGGLLLDQDAAQQLHSNTNFPVSQDQRNTARASVRYQTAFRLWLGVDGWYGSGLPVELDQDVDLTKLTAAYGAAVLDRINFRSQRLRPSSSLGLSAGSTVWSRDDRRLKLQADVSNVFNMLNVINFSGLFSGTALGMPRRYGMRAEFAF
ncbi:MAG: TonB-dependent receptor [Candidatus Angelobacter sp.]|jgi:hypothetical protein|nr:TonB-dependent receptor [Candidatus Angelobacter sp.]